MIASLKYHTAFAIGMLLLSVQAFAQVEQDTCLIRGFVFDVETAEPLLQSTVLAKGVQIYAVTDINGFYELRIPRGDLDDGEEVLLEIQALHFETTNTSVGFRQGTVTKQVYLKPGIDYHFDRIPELEEKVGMNKMYMLPPKRIPTISYGEGGGCYLGVMPGKVTPNPDVHINGWVGPGSCLRIDVSNESY